MKYALSLLIGILSFLPSTFHAQCYDVGLNNINFDPNPILPVEEDGKTTMTVEFCNYEDEIPNDPAGNTSVSICAVGLEFLGNPTGTYADNFEWEVIVGCLFGTIPKDSVTTKGCGTIVIEYEVTVNSTPDNPLNAVNINIQPAGIVGGNACNDVMDDNLDLITYTQSGETSSTQNLDNSKFVVYPNPTSSKLFIQLESISGNGELSIKDIRGQLIQKNNYTINQNSTNFIATDNLKSGTYFIELKLQDKIYIQKFIVQ